ncbi:hypothetical protein [Sorangium sp. So ce128]
MTPNPSAPGDKPFGQDAWLAARGAVLPASHVGLYGDGRRR